jgi:hypothetical protein
MGRPSSLPPLDAPAPQRVPTTLVGAVCASLGSPESFYDEEDVEPARAVCRRCPLAAACLDYALENEEHGIWGGTTPAERLALRGGAVLLNTEVRQRAAELRVDLAGEVTHEQIASKWDVSTRTVERAARQLRASRAA